jgi:C_GCAxxG_C_C family probable redox protein
MKVDAKNYFYNGGLNCAESTLRCLIEDGVIDVPLETVRMMTGFGGGMQRGTTCGAVVAAVAAIGWVTGRIEPGESRAASAAAVRAFLQQFEAEFGTLDCKSLRAVYAKEHALKSDGMYRSCTAFVERAIDLVQNILAENTNQQD